MEFLFPLVGGLLSSIFGGGEDKQSSPLSWLLPLLIGGGATGLAAALGGKEALVGKEIQPQAIPTVLPQNIGFQNLLMGTMLHSMGMNPNLLFGGQNFWDVLTKMPQPFYPDYSKLFGGKK